MGGASDDWWVLLFYPVVFWVPLGPFVMAALGVWNAREPGPWPRLWSVLLPLEPVVTLGVVACRPGKEPGDYLMYFGGYVLGITVLPWVLGWGITRAVRAVRARRGPDAGPGAA
ncbi:hypothetical protein [Kitasatospora sp. NPDC093679]|uniref:hypothetical protein n=1 Tax=Kitasatospora sp. NPDC093679 TaxID=3154983 RepID=UPI003438B24D